MRFPWQRKSRSQQTKGVIGSNDLMAQLLPLFAASGASTPAAALQLYEQSSSVSNPIDWVADPCADIEPVLEGPDGKFDTTHKVLGLLSSPSPDFTGRLFRSVLAHDFLITGEAFVAGIGNPEREPIDIQPLSPSVMSELATDTGVIGAWDVTGETLKGRYTRQIINQQARYTNLDNAFGTELKQIRGYSTRSNSLLRGQSPLVSAHREARQHLLGLLHNTALLEHGGRGSLVFKYAQEFDDDDFQATIERIRSQYGGAGNAGKIMVEIAESLEISELGVSNRDMDFANLQQIAMRAVALKYKVPLPLVTTDASTFANFEASILALYDYAVLPLFRNLFDGISDMLLPRFKLDPKLYRLTYDPNSISALMTRRIDELTKRRGLFAESGNEIRSLLGREEADDFNTIPQPGNWIPAGTDLFTADNERETEL